MTLAGTREIEFGPWALQPEQMADYLRAVDDQAAIYGERGVIPPLALVAHLVSVLLKQLSLPAGTLHSAQELQCHRAVRVGEEVRCRIRVSRPLRRGPWQFISTDATFFAADGATVLQARTRVMVPVKEPTVVQLP